MYQNIQIKSFISNIIDKNYAAATKDLKTVVESKIKKQISKAKKKDLF